MDGFCNVVANSAFGSNTDKLSAGDSVVKVIDGPSKENESKPMQDSKQILEKEGSHTQVDEGLA